MVQSKEWDWKSVEQSRWLVPSEDSVYLAKKWKEEGVHSILDLGCGLGRHALYFAQKGFNVTAVDLSADAVDFNEKLKKEYGVEYLCKKADMMELPFANNAFDRVFSYHVISHQDTVGVQHVLDEIARVLKPGGKVFLTLCSKEHYAFSEESFPRVDENTVLKTEEGEVDVPHFFADKAILKKLFADFSFESVRHITECQMGDDASKERSHYFVEAVVQKEATNK